MGFYLRHLDVSLCLVLSCQTRMHFYRAFQSLSCIFFQISLITIFFPQEVSSFTFWRIKNHPWLSYWLINLCWQVLSLSSLWLDNYKVSCMHSVSTIFLKHTYKTCIWRLFYFIYYFIYYFVSCLLGKKKKRCLQRGFSLKKNITMLWA